MSEPTLARRGKGELSAWTELVRSDPPRVPERLADYTHLLYITVASSIYWCLAAGWFLSPLDSIPRVFLGSVNARYAISLS